MSRATTETKRLITLDRLRGFFIVVIIADHLSRWPSVFSLLTGKALLWVTAAEGFVAISGLLVGYVRGYKNRSLPMHDVSKKLLTRAALLYIWAVIASLVYTAFIWYVPLQGGAPGMPIEKGMWLELLWKSLTLQYTYVWVYFLSLYALFLAASPIAVWLLRQNKAWLVALISIGLLAIGWHTRNEPLQWQFLFFIPAIAGYYLEGILSWWHTRRTTQKKGIAAGFIMVTLGTIILSIIATFYSSIAPTFSEAVRPLFEKDSISLFRAAVAFIWFVGFIFLFSLLRKPIGKLFDWLLLPIGTHSLTAYILHGVALIITSAVSVSSANPLVNSLLTVMAVLITWGMLRIPHINKIIPR
jgi:hypothetical protein